MGRYRSKPSEIEAVQWTGRNHDEVRAFLDGSTALGWDANPEQDPTARLLLLAGKDGAQGRVPVPVGHWIVRQPGDLTDHWPVDPDYFDAKYEPADG